MLVHTAHKKPSIVLLARYGIVFLLTAAFVLLADNTTLSAIATANVLIPVFFYALGGVWCCLAGFLLLRRVANPFLSFVASTLAGIPLGLILVEKIITTGTEQLPELMLKLFF